MTKYLKISPNKSSKPRQSIIASRVLSWFDQHGRKDLPWQHDITPYRVWVSEIMLQQTQVSTVIDYFDRFMSEFPSVELLAEASEDQVLHLWTGLGYYSRARNLHKTAQLISRDYAGDFPNTVEALTTLPGIGRSTAGAIVSIAFKQKAVILDGNVKRVLARHQTIGGWPGKTAVANQLWQIADAYTPEERVADYSQAMMDLGATLCTRSKPACSECPIASDCLALATDSVTDFPGKKPKKAMPIKSAQMLIALNSDGEVLLEKRPSSGIWGGLWVFPQLDINDDVIEHCLQYYGIQPEAIENWQVFRHTFSHYHFDISPVVVKLGQLPTVTMEGNTKLWYNRQQPPSVGLAAPIKTLMGKLPSHLATQ